MIVESVIVAALALVLDIAFGDPKSRYHPTAWIGTILAVLVPLIPNHNDTTERLGGILAVSAVTALVVLLLLALNFSISLITTDWIVLLASIITGVVLLKTTIAIRGMEHHAMHIVDSLERGDLDSARANLSMIVKRKTGDLDDNHVISGVLESISENTVDGVTGPIFYYAFFGLPGAFVYRTVNTADSMIGYKTRIFENVGWFAARCDTVLNYIPARLTGLLMTVSAAILRYDWRASYSTMMRDHKRTASPNAGYPMAALAGALGARLEKPGHYTLGDGATTLSGQHVRAAVTMMRLTSVLFLCTVTVPIISALSTLGWWPHA